MPAPHIPTPLEQLGGRPFSFYPAISGFERNEWRLRRSGADEFQVVNTKSNQEVWIPRRLFSGVSSIEEPVVIVGLVKELEFQKGVVVPLVHRVIEMPRAVNDIPWRNAAAEVQPGYLAPVVGIRLSAEPDNRKGRVWMARIAAGVLTCVVGLIAFRDGPFGARARFFTPAPRVALPFGPDDGYSTIVKRAGRPDWVATPKSPDGETFQVLGYGQKGYILVLKGASREEARYIGALGRGARILQTVQTADGRDSKTLLESLRWNAVRGN